MAKSFFYACTEIVRKSFSVSLSVSSNKFANVSIDRCQHPSLQKPEGVLPVWARHSTFSEADIQIEGLQWMRLYVSNAAVAVVHGPDSDFNNRPLADSRVDLSGDRFRRAAVIRTSIIL